MPKSFANLRRHRLNQSISRICKNYCCKTRTLNQMKVNWLGKLIQCTPRVGLGTDSVVIIFIYDLPDNIKSLVLLFVDDCVLYRNIHSLQDSYFAGILIFTVCALASWEASIRPIGKWSLMLPKCHSMRVTQHYSHKQILHDCTSKPWKTFSPHNILTYSQS